MLAINTFIEKEKREWEAHYKRAIKDGTKPYPAKGKKKLLIINNTLSCKNWDALKKYIQILKPLKETTELLKGRAAQGKLL